ncbi:hypothetical protein PENTCL1PPCAC_689, partial [Pristionchus entomophagus]
DQNSGRYANICSQFTSWFFRLTLSTLRLKVVAHFISIHNNICCQPFHFFNVFQFLPRFVMCFSKPENSTFYNRIKYNLTSGHPASDSQDGKERDFS